MKKTALFLGTIALSLFARDIMKVTLKDGSVSEEKISQIVQIEFTGNSMVSLSNYDLDNIQKIEFYDDGTSIAEQKAVKPVQDKIAIAQHSSKLEITGLKSQTVSVSVYSMNGRKVAELFNGKAAGMISTDISRLSLGAGVYSIVVRSGSDLFVQKMIKQ